MTAGAPDLLDALAREPALAAKLRAAAQGECVAFEHVEEGAHSALCAVLARAAGENGRRLWLVCPALRAQEQLHNELIQWHPDALFFPELEIAPVEGALPDPEVVAERLAILQRLTHSEAAAGIRRSAAGKVSPEHVAQQERASEIIVVTRSALNEAVPDSEQMRLLEVRLTRGDTAGRDALLARLADAGYERVSQVSQRGQFAVRGGIVDVFSFQHTLPVRLEFFGDELESIRHFDLDAQTSVEQLQTCTLLLGQAASRERRLRDCIGEEDITVDVAAEWLEADVTISVDSVAENFTTEDTEEGAGNSEGDSRHISVSWTRRGASGSSRNSPSGARRAGARSSFATTRARSSGCTT